MNCPECRRADVVRNGTYKTPQHGRVQRYRCKNCKVEYSVHTPSTRTKEHRPELNQEILDLYKQGLSERDIAERLGCARLTVRRKLQKHL